MFHQFIQKNLTWLTKMEMRMKRHLTVTSLTMPTYTCLRPPNKLIDTVTNDRMMDTVFRGGSRIFIRRGGGGGGRKRLWVHCIKLILRSNANCNQSQISNANLRLIFEICVWFGDLRSNVSFMQRAHICANAHYEREIRSPFRSLSGPLKGPMKCKCMLTCVDL